MIIEEKTYRPDEVAIILAISVRQVYRLLSDPNNPIPSIRISNSLKGRVRVPGRDLIQWIEDHKQKPWE